MPLQNTLFEAITSYNIGPITFFALVCLWPGAFAVLAYVFTAMCVVTTVLRWRQGWTEFSENMGKKLT